MDIRMPELDGLEASRRILAPTPRPRVLILTTFDLDEYVYEALRAGASGFVLKDDPPEQLIGAVRIVAAGDALLSPAVTRRVIEQFTTKPRPEPPAELDELTAREREIFVLIARGCRTPRSPSGWSSATRRSRPTSRTSSRSSASGTASRPWCSAYRTGF